MIPALVAALSLVLLAANPPPPPADAPSSDSAPATAPNAAVVGGHHLQPRPGEGSDVSKRDADDVDRLYQELMRQTAPDAARAKGSSAAPP
jgi:hypothetical protein